MCQAAEHPGSSRSSECPFCLAQQNVLITVKIVCGICAKEKKKKGSVLHHVGVKRISVKDLSVPVLPPQIRGRNTGKNGVT